MSNPRMDQELLEYEAQNLRIYGCLHCKKTDVTLKAVGQSSDGLTLYSCLTHELLGVPR